MNKITLGELAVPVSSNVFVRTTGLLLLVGFLALAAIVGTTIWLVDQNQKFFEVTTDARMARAATVNLRTALQDAETGQRGYLLTRDARYLEPYEAAVTEIPGMVEQFSTALAPFPESAAKVAPMREDIADKLAELGQTVALTRQSRYEEALDIVRTNRGKAAMDEARAQFDTLIGQMDTRIIDGIENQRGASQALRIVTILGALAIFAVAAGSVWLVMTYTRELDAAQKALDVANVGLEERVRERTADLGRANEEIQRFAYIVTHDLRAPLVNIMGFTSELETSVADLERYMATRQDDGDVNFADARIAATEDLPEAIGFIRAATRKMDGLINAILKISREGRRQLKPEALDLAAIAQTSVSSVQHQLAENGGEAQIDVDAPRFISDRLSVEQILGNLLDNAIKYRNVDRPLELKVRARPLKANRLEIEVEDNGRGIAPSDHERVFELFRRAGTQTQPGEGIGLAHVRTMARSLGGDITLRSELGAGTTFILTLPRDLRSHLGARSHEQ